MPTTIKLRNSVTTTSAPSSLVQGEVAINITDKKVWVGNAATTPIQLLGDGGSASFTSIAFGAGTVSSPSITFTGDTNTGIYSPAADTIAFTEGGVESMRIDSAGNVGIGTSSPSVRLQTNGAVAIQGTAAFPSSGAGIELYYDTTNGSHMQSYDRTASAWKDLRLNSGLTVFSTAGSERMRIDSSGNVGIGNSNPSTFGGITSLSIGGSNRGLLTIRNASNADRGYVYFDGTNFNVESVGTALNLVSPSAQPIIFTNVSTERMRIDSSGNLLVGTTSNIYPSSGRTVINVNGTSQALIGMQTGGNAKAYILHDGTDQSFWNQANGIQAFATNNTERMRITSGGNLYIGTTQNYGNGHKVEIRFTGGTTEYGLGLEADSLSTGTQWLEFTSGGGTIRGSIDWSGSAVRYNTSSDYRLKENIAPMTGALEKVSQLKPSTYVWKEDGSIGQGFIAHELAEVIPEAVSGEKDALDKNGNPKYQGIDTSFLVATLTAAIQEQQAMIEELKQEVAALKAK